MRRFPSIFLFGFLVSAVQAAEPATISLAGDWRFRLDPHHRGIKEQWAQAQLPDKIQLPGSLQEQGYGDQISVQTAWTGQVVDRSWYEGAKYELYRQPGHIKIPFWLQPERHYLGAAWYQRAVNVPAGWKDKRIVLFLERPHWETRIWVDGRELGMRHSLSTPHEYDLTADLIPGKTHRLTIRVDNTLKINVGNNAHSVSDHTQSNWNGITGRLELAASDRVWIKEVQVFPEVATRQVRLQIQIGNATAGRGRGSLQISVKGGYKGGELRLAPVTIPCDVDLPEARVECVLALGKDAKLWDEFDPALYRLELALSARLGEADFSDTHHVTFGLRQLSTQGTRIMLNHRPIFLRGTLECCIFPRTGYPAMDTAAWKRMMRISRAHGLNHLRFHSWCPPAAAFTAADELGFYLQVECAAWTTIGDGQPIDRWIHEEGDRILRAYGNHPSFIMLAYGNEPGGGRQKQFLGELVNRWKRQDPRRLYTGGAGWPVIPENDFHNLPGPRIHQWGHGLKSRLNARPPETTSDYRDLIQKFPVPTVSHEIGQWCVYPNFLEIPKYTGVLKARNFEIFQADLAARGMVHWSRTFFLASGKLQALCYKEEIESALRTPGFGGFQLLQLHDFPGQGTALVGVLDPFWESKGYVSAEEFRRFAGETVPLARLPKRIWTNNETFKAFVELSHFGPSHLTESKVAWAIKDSGGTTFALGVFPTRFIPAGSLTALGQISLPLAALTRPEKLNLEVTLKGLPYANDWDFWVYPASASPGHRGPQAGAAEVLMVEQMDDRALAQLQAGGKVLWMPVPHRIKGDDLGRIPAGFSSIFWNTAWTRRQSPHTLGIYCDPAHRCLADFPTEFHSNWQWWDLVTKAHPFILDHLRGPDLEPDPALEPVVGLIDDWFTNRRLALLFEAQVAGGKLMACGIDLRTDLEHRPVARQLLRSLLRYMNEADFKPSGKCSVAALRHLVKQPSWLQRLGASAKANSAATGHVADQAIDGDPATIWHTSWEGQRPSFPHCLTLDLKAPVRLHGCKLLPRQDMTNGWIQDYAIRVSRDGVHWGEPIAQGRLTKDKSWKTIRFTDGQIARYIRLEARSGFDEQPFASLAELELLPSPPPVRP